MKPKTIVGLLLMVGFASLLFFNFGQQVGGYMNFTEAQATGHKAHVVGTWAKDRPVQYDPNQNLFVFFMADEQGNVRRVHYANPKPPNFEDAERLVVEGQVRGDVFEASNILVKCPSKYNDERSIQSLEANS